MKTVLLILIAVTPLSLLAKAGSLTVAHPQSAFPADRTVVWSPLFQASWDKLNETLGGPPVRIDPPNALMTNLDTFRWNARNIMPEGRWKVWGGDATPEFLEQVNREAAAITREPKGPFTLGPSSPGSKAAFGLLDREVVFETNFFRARRGMEFRLGDGTGKDVAFFGVRGEVAGEFRSVRVLSWRPIDGSHAIQVPCKDTDDTVIFYRPAAPQDFATACLWVRNWAAAAENRQVPEGAWNDRSLHAYDDVRIPYAALEALHDFTGDLQGLRYYQNVAVPYFISRAEQKTRFELHEKGARVRVETSLSADPFAESKPEPPPKIPRIFAYNRPFFVFLWRKNAGWPYFGAWIGDASALELLKQPQE